MKHTMRKFLALMMALMLSLSAFALAEEAPEAPQAVEQPGEAAEPESPEGQEPEAPQEPQTEPEDGDADAGEDAIAIEAVDAVYAEQSADLVEEEPDLPVDEAAELPVEEDVCSEDAAEGMEKNIYFYVYGKKTGEMTYNEDNTIGTFSIGEGTATIDDNTHTLTLENCTDIYFIKILANSDTPTPPDSEAQESPYEAMHNAESTVPDFTIVLKGINTINATDVDAMYSDCPLTIKGPGTLTITYKGSGGCGIKAMQGFTLESGTVTVNMSSEKGAYAIFANRFIVKGGEITLDVSGVTAPENGMVSAVGIFKGPPIVEVDLSKLDFFSGDSKEAAKQLPVDADNLTKSKATQAKYVRIVEKKKEEATPTNPPETTTMPTPPATPAPSVDLMFCRLTCKDANGKPIKNGFTVKWSAMDGVDGYDVFMARCGKKYALAGTVEKGKPTSLTVGNLKVGKCYKVYVAPYVMKGSEKVYLGMSKKAHAFTNNGNDKKTNPAGIRVRKKMAVRVGKRKALNAKILSMDTSRDLVNHVRKIRYFTSDPNVATVSKKGKVKGVGEGNCVIYVVANNGICKQVDITVKPAK